MLMGIMLFSLSCPFIQWPVQYQIPTFVPDVPYAEEIWQGPIQEEVTSKNNEQVFYFADFLANCYLLGLLIGLILLSWKLLILLNIRLNAKRITLHSKSIWLTDHPEAPFSWGKWIFLSRENWKEEESDMILIHEEAHVKEKHSLDTLLASFLKIVCWYNPLCWHMGKYLPQLHEYLADQYTLRTGISKEEYLRLIQQKIQAHFLPAHAFFRPSIKNRIQMMIKPNTTVMMKAVYLAFLPIGALLFFSFVTPITSNPMVPTPLVEPFTQLAEEIIQVPDDHIPSIKPLKEADIKRMSSGFGMRIHPASKKKQMHWGIDFAAEMGKPVIATADGEITTTQFRSETKGYGRRVVIKHSEVYTTSYSHLSGFNCKVGQQVKKGEVIGYIGSSGQSWAPHLHYEVFKDGKRVDPAAYFGLQ